MSTTATKINRDKPIVAVTMGDPAGIGPEVCLSMLTDPAVRAACTPIVFGDAAVLRLVADRTGRPAPPRAVAPADWPAASAAGLPEPAVLDLGLMAGKPLQAGVVSADTGAAAFGYIDRAIAAALAGEVDAVCTAPVHKEALHAAGVPFPGHTEIFAAKTAAARACMMLTSDELTCSFVTTHVGYRDVPGLLSIERILDVIELTDAAMRAIRGRPPKMIVNGLNPHAGENGLFGGQEEERFIIPAIERARAKGLSVEGPLPPDTAFLPKRRKQTDAFVCIYHDQGHIPLKMLAFDSAINVTLGLPIIRTSVDHGTACDIAWQGRADHNSMVQATLLAARLAAAGVRA
jgi:4-hydroxythreonine-4-phosphate dehydrogenase